MNDTKQLTTLQAFNNANKSFISNISFAQQKSQFCTDNSVNYPSGEHHLHLIKRYIRKIKDLCMGGKFLLLIKSWIRKAVKIIWNCWSYVGVAITRTKFSVLGNEKWMITFFFYLRNSDGIYFLEGHVHLHPSILSVRHNLTWKAYFT